MSLTRRTCEVVVLTALTFSLVGMSACRSGSEHADALYNTIVLDATKTGLGEYIAQTMGGGRLANQYMPLVRVVPVDSLAAAESTVVKEMRQGKASGYLVVDSNTVRAKSARYFGKRARSPEDMELIRGAIKENALALEMRKRGIDPALVDSLTAKPVELSISEK